MLIGVVALATWFMVAGGFSDEPPPLSIITFLPLLGALVILVAPADARSARWSRSCTTLVDFALSLVLWANFDGTSAGFQFVEQAAWLGHDITYHMGVDGISMLFIVLTAGLMPFCILASWKSIETRVRRIHDRLPGARDADDRRVLRARSRPVLRVLRGRADPDVPHHRRVGRQAARLCELQVLPLHAARLAC